MAGIARALNTNLAASVTLTSQQQHTIQQQMQNDLTLFPLADTRTTLLLLDLAYYLETSEHINQTAASKIITTTYKELELPVLQPNIDAAWAYLVGTFLSGSPIMGVVKSEKAPDELKNAAKQMEAIIDENSRMSGWARQLMLMFKSALKYNVAAVEIDWVVRQTFQPITDTTKNLTQAVTNAIYRAGNEIKNLDMYNLFYDTTVPVADVVSEGDYVGKVEVKTLVQLHDLITTLRANGGTVMNVNDDLWKSAPKYNQYHTPRILNQYTINPGTNWMAFFSINENPLNTSGKPLYEVTTYYRKIIPHMLGLTNVPDAHAVQIWKFIDVNGRLIYAQRKSNAHNLLPTVFCQPHEDNVRSQAKGLGQTLLPYQKLAGTMYRARVADLARALSDRGLYDPSRISEKNINSTSPTAKIPVRPSAYGKPVGEAYYPIPYDGRNGQMIHQDIAQVIGYASEAAHINKNQRGQFTKGNRTLEEYRDTMDNAEAPQQATAILIHNQTFVPLQYQIKTNILQYQSSATLTDPNTREPVEVDPVGLRRQTLEFQIANGLTPKDRLLGTQATMEFFQIMSSIPGANQEYDLIGMMADTYEAKGVRIKHRKRPEMVSFQEDAITGQSASGVAEAAPAGVTQQ